MKKILIVEDEYDLANIIKKYLEHEQYEVELCRNGAHALSLFNSYRPDFLLLDIMLPGMDGLEILRQIRTTSSVPIMIISAKEAEFDRILGLKIGADDYLTKPFSVKELVTRIEVIFRRMNLYTQPSEIKQFLHYADYEIDLVAREVKKRKTILALTTKEYDLLVFLLLHPRQVFSKNQIYEQVWGMNGYGDMNTITIHIQKLREKLGLENAITTIRGIGYRFDGEVR